MYCSNCGKEVKENDNFCRFCGIKLNTQQEESFAQRTETKKIEKETENEVEEIVLYEIKKHWIDLVVPSFLTPLFFLYFWNIFLNSHSLFSWIIMFSILGLIVYPIARYKSDRIVITNKFVHIKSGVLNPVETDIPMNELESLELSQTTMGRMFDYGFLGYITDGERKDYGNIKTPEELEYIIENPESFIEENLN